MSTKKATPGESFAALILAIIGGLALASILDHLNPYRCPSCDQIVEKGVPYCSHCYTMLRWN